MKTRTWQGLTWIALVVGTATFAHGQVKYIYERGPSLASLPYQISDSDLLHNLPASSILLNTDLSAGWPNNTNGYVPIHGMPPAAVCDSPLNNPDPAITGFHDGVHPDAIAQKLKLVDGQAGDNIDSVLTDFAWPAAVFQFDLPEATDIGEIRVFAANTARDGRVFQNYDVAISTDPNPDTKERVFAPLIERVIVSAVSCANPPFGDGFFPNVNNGTQVDPIEATVSRVFNEANPIIATGVTSIRFTFWAVSNTDDVFWDQWLGPNGCPLPPGENSATYYDVEDHDGFKRAFESSVIKEIDVFAVRTDVPFEICDDGIDNTGNGLIDGEDPECFGRSCPPEVCDDGIDNTGNSLVDCDDPDCRDAQVCLIEICDDGIDNTGNGLIDCEDPQCFDDPVCQCNTPWADADDDGDVDHDDFAIFQRCYTGPVGTIPTIDEYACACFDRNEDGVIDQQDLISFKNCAGGPNLPPLPGCDP